MHKDIQTRQHVHVWYKKITLCYLFTNEISAKLTRTKMLRFGKWYWIHMCVLQCCYEFSIT